VQPTAGPAGPRPSYTITGVTPGAYYVFAFRRDTVIGNDIPAVYSRFVVDCMQPSEGAQKPVPSSCPNDHTLVQVNVRPGETVSQIDVTDWNCSLPGSTCPPRPRERTDRGDHSAGRRESVAHLSGSFRLRRCGPAGSKHSATASLRSRGPSSRSSCASPPTRPTSARRSYVCGRHMPPTS